MLLHAWHASNLATVVHGEKRRLGEIAPSRWSYLRVATLMTFAMLAAPLAFSGFRPRPTAQPVLRARSRPAVAGLFDQYGGGANEQYQPPPQEYQPPAAAAVPPPAGVPQPWAPPTPPTAPVPTNTPPLPACIARGVPLTGDTLSAALKMRCDQPDPEPANPDPKPSPMYAHNPCSHR